METYNHWIFHQNPLAKKIVSWFFPPFFLICYYLYMVYKSIIYCETRSDVFNYSSHWIQWLNTFLLGKIPLQSVLNSFIASLLTDFLENWEKEKYEICFPFHLLPTPNDICLTVRLGLLTGWYINSIFPIAIDREVYNKCQSFVSFSHTVCTCCYQATACYP